VPFDDRRVDLKRGQWLAAGSPLDQQLQLVLGVEALHRARRIVGVVPQPGLVAVGVEDDRPLAEHGLQAVGVELRLLLAHRRIAPGPLRLDQPERRAVVAPQHVVDEPGTLVVGHAGDLELAVAWLVEGPAGFGQQHVDERVAGLGLVVVVIVRARGVRRLDRSDLRSKFGDLLFQRGVLLVGPGEIGILRCVLGCLGLELLESQQSHARRHRFRDGVGVEMQRCRGQVGGIARIAAGQPVQDVEQLAHHRHGVIRRQPPLVVHSRVALLSDQVHLELDAVAAERQ